MARPTGKKYPKVITIRSSKELRDAVDKIAEERGAKAPDVARYLLDLGIKRHQEEMRLLEQIRAQRSQIDISALRPDADHEQR